ncbi:hypothetical protein GCM10023331_31870 [Algivirga pacifica]|uniref:Uncharacterized protein n=1 Tax=Algivirga pacifica TaxID=1162670 RepID=A0ABP9DK74_9BACT
MIDSPFAFISWNEKATRKEKRQFYKKRNKWIAKLKKGIEIEQPNGKSHVMYLIVKRNEHPYFIIEI